MRGFSATPCQLPDQAPYKYVELISSVKAHMRYPLSHILLRDHFKVSLPVCYKMIRLRRHAFLACLNCYVGIFQPAWTCPVAQSQLNHGLMCSPDPSTTCRQYAVVAGSCAAPFSDPSGGATADGLEFLYI
jgi:hypothetical protein